MHTIIVMYEGGTRPEEQIRLRPGESLEFGSGGRPSGADRPYLAIPHDGVSRTAGRITATGAFWTLSNLNCCNTYVVENPEGAGEHIKVAPGRLDAPVPFEFARLVVPAGGELLSCQVWAPRHDYAEPPASPADGEPMLPAFPLDRSARYFLVLAALTEPRLRGAPHAPIPTVSEVVHRLLPVWPEANPTTVQWNIDYLAVKMRLKPASGAPGSCGRRLNGKKEALASLALRFDLIREEELTVLEGRHADAVPGWR
ncbi:FHA domain-containing protein [Streptomyces sp. B6B3]|uniref:FHA domain-containing protein n=1 Tax=Streptomyces sp. B6B3 TaxID=3153570 RepID=UPI00325D541F